MRDEFMALAITLFLGLFILVGAVIAFSVKKKDKFIDFTLALAFSVILMLLFTDMMPEAQELLGMKYMYLFVIFVIVGVFLLRFLDFFIPDHEEEVKMSRKKERANLTHIGIVSLIALVIHNIIEGMAIYSTSISSFRSGIMIALGVGCHNIPLGMVITSTIYQNNQSKKKTLLSIAFLMFSTFLGGLVMFFMNGAQVNEMFLGILLSLTIGMLIYICSNELYPRMKHAKNKKMVFYGVLIGIFLIAITSFL